MKRGAQNFLALAAADAVVRVAGFAVVAIVGQRMGTASLGILAFGSAVMTYGALVSTWGLPLLGTRRVAAEPDQVRDVVAPILQVRTTLSFAAIIIGGVLVAWVVPDTLSRNVAWAYLLGLIPSALLLDWMFQGQERMTTVAVGQIAGVVVFSGAVYFFATNERSLVAVPFAALAGTLVQAALLGVQYFWRPHAEGTAVRSSRLILLIESLPLGLTALVAQAAVQFPFLYLALRGEQDEAGLLSAAFRVVVLMLAADRVFAALFLPAIRRVMREAPDALPGHASRTLKGVTVAAVWIATGATIFAPRIFPLLFGQAFREAAPPFAILMIHFACNLVNSVLSFTLIAAGKEGRYLRALAMAGTIGCGAMLLPLPAPALTGAAALSIMQMVAFLAMRRDFETVASAPVLRTVLPPAAAALIIATIFFPYPLPPIGALGVTAAAGLVILASARFGRADLRYWKERLL